MPAFMKGMALHERRICKGSGSPHPSVADTDYNAGAIMILIVAAVGEILVLPGIGLYCGDLFLQRPCWRMP